MPGVTVLPPSSALRGVASSRMQNGYSSSPNGTVAEIKEVAKEQVQKVKGASPLSLLRSARTQITHAKEYELNGELKNALAACTKAAHLVSLVYDSADYKAELQSGRGGVLQKELYDFQQHEGADLHPRVKSLEARITEEELSQSSASSEHETESSGRPVGSIIADRIRSLQNGGLAVSTNKRLSREVTSPPHTAIPPEAPAPKPQRISLQNLSSPPNFATLASPAFASAAVPSPHALVPTSSFGPPSPSSSTGSSPRTSHMSLTEFATSFPSIDELEEQDVLRLPSVPTGSSAGRSPFMPPRFPALPMDPGPRPSSTPIPPTIDTFNSRPASPAPGRSPLSPTVPRKPSGLSLRSSSSRSPVLPPSTPSSDKGSDVPVTTSLFPKTLMEYHKRPNFKVLLLDVRTREEFEREHIKTDTVVCIEPSVLLRSDVTADTIENALVIAPRGEQVLFSNRDKFDLVGIYDDSSETFGDAGSPLSILTRVIYEVALRKFLKHPPVLLVGGLQAWKREYGEAELVRGEGSASVTKSPGSVAGLINGVSSMGLNGMSSPPPPSSYVEPRIGGHIRAPAETASIIATTPVSSGDQALASRPRAETVSAVELQSRKSAAPPNGHYTGDLPVSMRPAVDGPLSTSSDSTKRLVRKPAMIRASSSSISYPSNPPAFSPTPAIPENFVTQHVSPPPIVNGTPIQYPSVVRHISPQVSGSSFSSSTGNVPLPPQASINPSPLSRRRSDYVDQSQEALSGLGSRPSIDYPDLSSQHILRPPPAAASSTMERQDNRPRLMQTSSYSHVNGMPKPPTIQSDYPVTYWADIQIGTSGLKNLGNTCYMNSTIQCLSATVPFARFFTDGRWKSAVNMMNPMGTKGNLANAFATILRDMWQGESQCLIPVTFRRSICSYAPQFGGTEQHDSQEFLNFLLDGLHEDLNRVLAKPQIDTTPEREAELEKLPVQIASEQEWQIWRMRNDSLVVDFFQGQFRNRLECLTCHKTSTTYNTFMYLTLPIPTGRSMSRVSLYQCLDAFVKEEVMEKSDAWNCPHCKTMRKATKTLSLSRLPPVLLIHLKRFSSKGHFTDKVETFVDYPLKNLDLTNYMPPPLPPGVHNGGQQLSRDDPRAQVPPYKYDLYGVTNHFGTLSSGHYTAFVSSRGGWLYCDDSRISQADPKDVVGKPAYMLFYKRIKP